MTANICTDVLEIYSIKVYVNDCTKLLCIFFVCMFIFAFILLEVIRDEKKTHYFFWQAFH